MNNNNNNKNHPGPGIILEQKRGGKKLGIVLLNLVSLATVTVIWYMHAVRASNIHAENTSFYVLSAYGRKTFTFKICRKRVERKLGPLAGAYQSEMS